MYLTLLLDEINQRVQIDRFFLHLAVSMGNTNAFYDKPKSGNCGLCCETLSRTFTKTCGRSNDYMLKYGYVFKNLCQTNLKQIEVQTQLLFFCTFQAFS